VFNATVISDFLLFKKYYCSEYKKLLSNFDFPLIVFKYTLLRLQTVISVFKCYISDSYKVDTCKSCNDVKSEALEVMKLHRNASLIFVTQL
jgi:hypothetical protein